MTPRARLDLWWRDLPAAPRPAFAGAGGLVADDPSLSADERARAASIKHAGSREAFLGARALLRHALTAADPSTSPEGWAFAVDAYGKPSLRAPSPPLAFNASHTDGCALVGVACAVEGALPGLAVGVDVERPRALDAVGLARRYFTAAEQAWAASDPQRRFFTLWTLKEAALKASGDGLSGLSAVEVSPLGEGLDGEAALQALRPLRGGSLHWRLRYGTRSGEGVGEVAFAYAVCAGAPFTLQVGERAPVKPQAL